MNYITQKDKDSILSKLMAIDENTRKYRYPVVVFDVKTKKTYKLLTHNMTMSSLIIYIRSKIEKTHEALFLSTEDNHILCGTQMLSDIFPTLSKNNYLLLFLMRENAFG
jgi:hypothetical protein